MDLSYLTNRVREGHMTPTPDVLFLWKDVKHRTNFKHIFEIGTNAGHSAAIILELFPDVKVTSIDIGQYDYTRVAANTLKEKFGDRFEYIEQSTVEYFMDLKVGKAEFPEGVDIINIDGDHSINGAKNDIELALYTNVPHILVDDFKKYGVPSAYNEYKNNFTVLCEYDYKYGRADVTIGLVKRNG